MINDYFSLNDTKRQIVKAPNKLRIVLWFWLLTIILFIIWASFAKVDEIVRGDGKIIPSGKNQIIQNLEGGIIKDILVSEGDIVKKGQTLIQIQNQKSLSSYEEKTSTIDALHNKIERLEAQSFLELDTLQKDVKLSSKEKSLYLTNIAHIKSKLGIVSAKELQENANYKEAKLNISHFKKSRSLLNEQLDLLEPLVQNGIRPKVDLLKLKQELNDINQKLDSSKESTKRAQASIKELQSKKSEILNQFKSKSKEDLNKHFAELERLKINSESDKDSVLRTEVKAPSNGIIQNLFIHTKGGVIKPGEELIELVPTDDKLLVQTRIKPSDIGFIYAKQKVIVKFTAYDFTIFGGLDGHIIKIGADTQVDEDGNSFYEVIIKTDKNNLGSSDRAIIPGMTVNVDILTGKKSILDYILKPILKTQQYTFTQR